MANEDFTTYTEEDPNSRITKTAAKVTWTALTNGEKAWVAKNKGWDYFNGDFIHQFEIEYSGSSGTPTCIFWAVANGTAFRDRADSGQLCYISFAWERVGYPAQYGLVLKCHKWGNGPTDWDVWENCQPSTKYFITIQHDWDGGINGTGRTTAWIRTGSHEGALQAQLSVDRGVGNDETMSYIYGCQTQDDEYEDYMSGFTENLDLDASLPPNYKLLAGTIAASSTVVASTLVIKTSKYLAGTVSIASTVTDTTLKRTRSVSRTTTVASTVTGDIRVYGALAGVIASECTVTGTLKVAKKLAGNVAIATIVTGDIETLGYKLLVGVISIQSIVIGDLTNTITLVGVISIQSVVVAALRKVQYLAGTISIESTAVATQLKLTCKLVSTVTIESTLSDIATIKVTRSIAGIVEINSTLTAAMLSLGERLLAGVIEIQSIVIGNLVMPAGEKLLAGVITIKSIITGRLLAYYDIMPPAMHAALIDPYSGGAWLWLVEINIIGYDLIKLARNPANVKYGGEVYVANNLDLGLAPLVGDRSVPRYVVKVAQDAAYTLEDKVNATRGAGGGTIKVIRTHEDFLECPVAELEQTIRILIADSDTTHVVFQLGMPNPLLKKVPLRRYSSKICPYALPGLFKGLECQYMSDDPTCTGKYVDCLAKGNAEHWGAELGLSPNTTRV